MMKTCSCETNKKYKYIHTLYSPEIIKTGKIPSKFSTPTTVFKRQRRIEYTTNDKGIIAIHWSPQAFYLTNIGIFLYNNNAYTGLTAVTPTSTVGLGTDTTNFVPSGTPIRLVSASMKVIYGGGAADGKGGVFIGSKYETSLSTNANDLDASLFTFVNSLNDVKSYRAGDGIKIIYTPYGPDCMNFYKLNSNLGRDGDIGNGLLTTQRFIFYGYELSTTQNCIQVTYTQIFEAITTDDYFSPSTCYLDWNPAPLIKEELIDNYCIITNLIEDHYHEEKLLEKIKKHDGKKEYNLSHLFLYPSKMKKIRLPSIFGECTSLFYQNTSVIINPSSNGAFCVQWLPQFCLTVASIQSGLYYNTNSAYDGQTNITVGMLTTTEFKSTTKNVFSGVRLVAASMTAKYISDSGDNLSGQFMGAINLDLPTYTTPTGTNMTFKQISDMQNCKSFGAFDGIKIIFVPYDYRCFNFESQNSLNNAIPNIQTLCQHFYICGYGFIPGSKIKLNFERIFEGIPTTYYSDYFATKSSKYTFDECKTVTENIINKDLLITSLLDENKILKLLNKN
jgi:hypothetical protein